LDNGFPQRVRAIEGEEKGLKCADGEKFFFFFERGKVEWALTE